MINKRFYLLVLLIVLSWIFNYGEILSQTADTVQQKPELKSDLESDNFGWELVSRQVMTDPENFLVFSSINFPWEVIRKSHTGCSITVLTCIRQLMKHRSLII